MLYLAGNTVLKRCSIKSDPSNRWIAQTKFTYSDYMANNGFDALKEALEGSDQFNLHQLNDLQQMVKDFGLDASDVAMGNRGDMVVDLVDSNNASLGVVGMIGHKWGYSIDKNNLSPTGNKKDAVFGVLNHHIDNGGLVS
jgi:hypothetical protein